MFRERPWVASLGLVILVNFFTYVGNFMLMATLPLHVLDIGGNKIMAAMVTGVYSMTGFVSRLKAGKLLDERRRGPVLVGGLMVLLAVMISYSAAAYSVAMLLMLRAMHGVGWSIATTSTTTIAADLIPSARTAECMGYFGISISVAMIIGPGLGLYAMEHYSHTALFVAAAGFIALALVTDYLNSHFFRGHGAEAQPAAKAPASAATKQAAYIEKSALWPSFLFFIVVITYSTIMIFLPPYAREKGVSDIGMFFVVIALAMMVTRLTMGRIADRYGAARVLVPGMLLLAGALGLLYLAGSLPLFLVAAVLYGLGYGIVQPALNSLVISLAPPERRGAANATFLGSMDMGGILGAVGWGVVAQVFGFSYIYAASAVLLILCVGAFWLRGGAGPGRA